MRTKGNDKKELDGGVIFVNRGNPYFTGEGKDFDATAAALVHEMQHVRQMASIQAYLTKTDLVPTTLVKNRVGYMHFKDVPHKIYAAQPVEAQPHVVQNAFTKILKRMPHSSR